MKVCFKCKVEKDLEDFHKQAKARDGRNSWCKVCRKAYRVQYDKVHADRIKKQRKEYRAANKERARETGIKWRAKNKDYLRDRYRRKKESIEEQKKEYREKYPRKLKALQAIRAELRSGRMDKPDRCSVCYAQGLIQGHHDDYAKPLEVRWLCVSCHKQWHSLHGEGLNAHEEMETYGRDS